MTKQNAAGPRGRNPRRRSLKRRLAFLFSSPGLVAGGFRISHMGLQQRSAQWGLNEGEKKTPCLGCDQDLIHRSPPKGLYWMQHSKRCVSVQLRDVHR